MNQFWFEGFTFKKLYQFIGGDSDNWKNEENDIINFVELILPPGKKHAIMIDNSIIIK